MKSRSVRRQQGAVTLVITLLVMIAVTIGSFALVQTSTLEKRMTANDQRSREAFNAAQAGVDFLLAHLSQDEVDLDVVCAPAIWTTHGFALNFDGPIDSGPAAGTLDFTSSTQEGLCRSVPYGLLTKSNVWSRGVSNDGESTRTIVSTIDLTSEWSWNYQAVDEEVDLDGQGPIIAQGNVQLAGNVDTGVCPTLAQCEQLARPGAGNREGNREIPEGVPLIRAGGNVTQTGGAMAFDSDNWVANDTDLATLSQDALFANYVADSDNEDRNWTTITDFKAEAAEYTPGSSPGRGSSTLSAVTSDLIYVSGAGDVATTLSLRNGTIGSPDRPVTIVVNGNLNLAGNVIIWGTVFVTGQADFSRGTNKIIGSLVTPGTVNMGGNPAVYFNASAAGGSPGDLDPDLLAELSDRTVSIRVGSWREVVPR